MKECSCSLLLFFLKAAPLSQTVPDRKLSPEQLPNSFLAFYHQSGPVPGLDTLNRSWSCAVEAESRARFAPDLRIPCHVTST
jgi:hypothetical protein